AGTDAVVADRSPKAHAGAPAEMRERPAGRAGLRSYTRASATEPGPGVVKSKETAHVSTRRGEGSVGAVLRGVEQDAQWPAGRHGCDLVAWRDCHNDAPDRRTRGRLGQHSPGLGPGRLARLRRSGRPGGAAAVG